MSEHATTTFEIRSWKEEPWDELDDRSRLTRASVVKTYSGELEGEGVVEQVAFYDTEGDASFTALERFRGRVGEREGTFVMQHEGTFREGKVDATWTVVPGSATGELHGMRGTASFASGHAERYEVTVELRFE